MKELIAIQNGLKTPKGKKNTFGNYNYRSCEDILEAVKPLCKEHNCLLTISDEMIMLGDRFYIKATATIECGDIARQSNAYARESESKKGMDSAQITGSASSYARKYALNGLFCIDDTKDADAMDNTAQHAEKTKKQPFNEYKKADNKIMTSFQKSTLKDQIVTLEKIGSGSCQKAITGIDELLGHEIVTFESASHLINRVKKTIEKEQG